MPNNRTIITVLDSVSPTTMPYNEFILYRATHHKQEKQIALLTSFACMLPKEQIPSDIELHWVGKNPLALRKEIKKILEDCKQRNSDYIFHLHSIRGSFSVLLAGIGLVDYKHTVYTIHSTFPGFKLHNKILSFLDALCARQITCASKTSYVHFPRFVKWLKKERIRAVQNGVNVERVEKVLAQTTPSAAADSVSFVYIARFVPIKQHDFLLDVIQQCSPQVRFIFIGEEDATQSIRHKAQEAGVLGRIEFTGLLPREEVYKRSAQADVYISSSRLEGLPVSALEGMACGLPAILSDIPQHRELVAGQPFISLLPFDVQRWANEINRYAAMSAQERRELGALCKEYVTKNFSLENMHRCYSQIYQEMLQ